MYRSSLAKDRDSQSLMGSSPANPISSRRLGNSTGRPGLHSWCSDAHVSSLSSRNRKHSIEDECVDRPGVVRNWGQNDKLSPSDKSAVIMSQLSGDGMQRDQICLGLENNLF